MKIEDVTSRVFEGGRFHYSFRCPSCGNLTMRIVGYSSPSADSGERGGLSVSLVCSGCGEMRRVSSLPVSHMLVGSS